LYGKSNFYNSSKFNIYSFLKLDDPCIEITNENNSNDNIIDFPYDISSPNLALYYKNYPDEEFLKNRKHAIDLSELHQLKLKTGVKTLNLYSYLFYLDKSLFKEAIAYMRSMIDFKQEFYKIFNNVFNEDISRYNCVSIRRGDYVQDINLKSSFVNYKFEICDFLNILKNNFEQDTLLVVLSDEKDLNYFKDLTNCFNNIMYLNNELLKKGFNDDSLAGLLGILAARKSDRFVGTMGSTYSSFIQQSRLLLNKKEDFRFLYTQRPYFILDDYGKCMEFNKNRYSWNRAYKKNNYCNNNMWRNISNIETDYWPLFREWPECNYE
jgi:hypothetical protein